MSRKLFSSWVLTGLLLALHPSARAGDDAGSDALRHRVRETRVNLDATGATFGEVVRLLRIQTGLNIVVDPRIASDVVENPVEGLFVEDLSLATVLDLLVPCGSEDTVWTVRDGVVVITNRAFMPAPLSVRILPVGGLVAEQHEFVPVAGGLVEGEPGREGGICRFGTVDELIELIKGGVAPRFWEETERADIRTLSENRIVVVATDEIHTQIERFLDQLESMAPDAILVDVQALSPGSLSADVPLTGRLDAEAAAALLTGDGAGPAVSLAVRAGLQSTAVAGSRQVRLTSGRAPGEGVSGMAVRVRAIPGSAGDEVLLKLAVALVGPSGAGGRSVQRRDSVLRLAPGVWHVAEGAAGPGAAGGWTLLVRATPVSFPSDPALGDRPVTVPAPERPGVKDLIGLRPLSRVDLDGADLDRVADFLRAATGLNVYITPRVRAECFDEIELTMNLADVPVATFLDLVTQPYELSWSLKENLLTIDRRDRTAEAMVLRYFDLKDLGEAVIPYENVQEDPGEDHVPEPVPLFRQEALVDLVRESIGSWETWEDPAAIEVRNLILIARNTQPVLDAIVRLLEELRRSISVVATTVDHVEMDAATARALLGDRGVGAGRLLLEREAVKALVEALADGRARALSREHLVSVGGSGAPRWTGEEIPYAAACETADVPPRSVVRQETLRSGVRLGVRTVPSYPSDGIDVEIAFDRSVLMAMGEEAADCGLLQVPELDTWNVATGLRIPDGRTAVVCATRAGGAWRLLLVTPVRVRASNGAGAEGGR